MNLKFIIDENLRARSRTFKWLVGEVGISHDGLKAGLENETIKWKDFKKVLSVLDLPIQLFFEGDKTVQKIKGNNNTQAINSIWSEPEVLLKRENEVERLKEKVRLLESQIEDKNKIIELISRKN
jgi:hypothetical protein